jgi:hypothetical protein
MVRLMAITGARWDRISTFVRRGRHVLLPHADIHMMFSGTFLAYLFGQIYAVSSFVMPSSEAERRRLRRRRHVVTRGAAGSLVIGIVGAVGVLTPTVHALTVSSATAPVCQPDTRSVAAQHPKKGLVLVRSNPREYIPVGLVPGGLVALTVDDHPVATPLIASWQGATDCTGDDLTRNGWAASPDGHVYTESSRTGAPAQNFGDTRALALNRPIVDLAVSPTGQGYWLLANDGGVFNFGDAPFRGSAGAIPLVKPTIAIAPTPSGNGYWLLATDGGIFSYGDAKFFGSGAIKLVSPIVDMLPTPTGNGYLLVASDGGVFAFGDAVFRGSLGGQHIPRPIAAVIPTAEGYALVSDFGDVYRFPPAP